MHTYYSAFSDYYDLRLIFYQKNKVCVINDFLNSYAKEKSPPKLAYGLGIEGLMMAVLVMHDWEFFY